MFKLGVDNLLRWCVTVEEVAGIIWHCHNSSYDGHFNGERTTAKLLQSGFYWPTLFKDDHVHARSYDKCQRIGSISKRNEIPLQAIFEVEVFDCWGIDFLVPYLYRIVMSIYWLEWIISVNGWKQLLAKRMMPRQLSSS